MAILYYPLGNLNNGGILIMITAIYPGSFDPVTNGHLDIVKRANKLFDRLIVAVLDNPRKTPLFSISERVKMLQKLLDPIENIEVDCYQGLLVDYVRKQKATIIIKGLRAISDFEFEFQMALINRKLEHRVETLFMVASSKYSYVSSSIVKEVASYGGDISYLVPKEVHSDILNKFKTSKFKANG